MTGTNGDPAGRDGATSRASRPLFTVAVAFRDSSRYLPATLVSLERQTCDAKCLDIVLVDDGSVDESAAIAEAWAKDRPGVRLIRQHATGPGGARNRALEVATGQWFTSLDSDDIVAPTYFEALTRFIERDTDQRASLLAPHIYRLNDKTGRFDDRHPLSPKWSHGDRLARLADEPEAFVLGTAFCLRVDAIQRHGLRYDPEIWPTFEDGHLIGRYLATFADPVVGIVASAPYYYRKRSNNESLVQSSWRYQERFTTVPERGYLDLFQRLRASHGAIPGWAQYLVLYDLLWYFKQDQSLASEVAWVRGPLARRFLGTVSKLIQAMDQSTLEQFCCNPHPWAMRQALITRFKTPLEARAFTHPAGGTTHEGRAVVVCRDDPPMLGATGPGGQVQVNVLGTRSHYFFGELFMTELTVGWPDPRADLSANGQQMSIARVERPVWPPPPPATYLLEAGALPPATGKIASRARNLRLATLATGRPMAQVAAQRAAAVLAKSATSPRALAASSLMRRSASPSVRAKYLNAWIIMDRPARADDNGEHLYRYLQNERPEINAFFLLSRKSRDWHRLALDGFRLLAYGSDESALALRNAQVRLASDATLECLYPASRRHYGVPPSPFVFLQHGVIKDDMSRWLNGKPIDLMVTSTQAEYDSLVGPGSPYSLLRDQVALTGLARFDYLLQTRQRRSATGPVLVMPTWRWDLAETLKSLGSSTERIRAFVDSTFWRAWVELLSSQALAEAAEATRSPARLLLHPNFQCLVPDVTLPTHVMRLPSSAVSYERELARSSLLLTDFSSLAFDAAYAGVPVIYYQFDRDHFYSGGHTMRPGYFSYDRDGFGPVACEVAEAQEALREQLTSGFKLQPPYADRVNHTFPQPDTENRARIVAAVENLVAARPSQDEHCV
jgi:glycosyltransferase involved in cell wall biosynthesis